MRILGMVWNVMRSFELMDPARSLEIRGEDCTNCASLVKWRLGTSEKVVCDNMDAPRIRRESAPTRRCHLWRHKDQPK